MRKSKFSISCDEETMKKIGEVARQNNTSRSNISRMLLQMIDYLPAEMLKETTPVPNILGIKKEN